MTKIHMQLLLEKEVARLVENQPARSRRRLRVGTVVWVAGQSRVKVPLTQGRHAIVDYSDAALVCSHNWCAQMFGSVENPIWYAARRAKKTEVQNGDAGTIKMHSFIMGMKNVDHRNSDGLNNLRSNLRLCTGSQNQGNARLRRDSTSKLKGVHFHKEHQKWMARINIFGIRKHLGYFDTSDDAAKAYNAAATERWGEFAKLNTTLK